MTPTHIHRQPILNERVTLASTLRDISIEKLELTASEQALPPLSAHSIAVHLAGTCVLEWIPDRHTAVMRPAGGDVTIIPAGRSGTLKMEGCASILKIMVPPAALALFVEEECAGNATSLSLLERHACSDPLLEQIGRMLAREVERPSQVGSIYADTLARALVAHLVRQHTNLYAGSSVPLPRGLHALSAAKAKRTVEIMEAHLATGMTLKQLAREVGLSPSHFAAQFSRAFGRSPGRYMTWLRLERAREALHHLPDQSAAKIAALVGFSSASHFGQAFKQTYGVSPGEYRSRL